MKLALHYDCRHIDTPMEYWQLEGVELSSCAPLRKVDFHRYEDWITLHFVK